MNTHQTLLAVNPTWTQNMNCLKFFLQGIHVQYYVYKDRSLGGGGVFLCFHETLPVIEQLVLLTDTEAMRANLTLSKAQSIFVLFIAHLIVMLLYLCSFKPLCRAISSTVHHLPPSL